jgi:hypothetical protein
MQLNAICFLTLNLFEVSWQILFQVRVYFYIVHEVHEGHNYWWFSLLANMIFGYLVMLYFFLLLLFFLFLVLAGWATGYWVLNKNDIQIYKDMLTTKDQNRESIFFNDETMWKLLQL